MNSRPMILRFSSGSVTPARAARNGLARVDDVEVDAGRGDEVALDLLGLALAQQPVVDEDAGAAGRRWRAARWPRRRRSRRRRTGRRSPGRCRRPARGSRSICSSTMLSMVHVWRAAGDVVEEVLEHLLAVLGVQHLGVPLDAGEPAVDVLERGDRGVLGRGEHGEALGRRVRRSRRATSRPCARTGCPRAGCPARRRRPAYGRTRARRCGRPRRRAPGPSAGSRSTSRRPAPRP